MTSKPIDTAAHPPVADQDPQLNLAPLPMRVEAEESEIETLVRKTTQEALERAQNITTAEVERMLEARAKLISTIRAIAIKQTAPEDWTLYRAKDGSVVGVPAAAAALKMRRWAGISIMNHRGMEGGEGPTVREIKSATKETVTLIEGYADGMCGRDKMPAVYFSVRSDDQFIGRAGKDTPRKGGPREQDLMSCWRTGIDSKIVRMMTGTTKVSETELKKLEIDTSRCVKGSGFGTGQQRESGRVADAGAAEDAEGLWNECVKRTSGTEVKAEELLKEITKGKNFAGFTDWKRMTQDWQIENAWKALRAHEVFGDEPQGR